MEEPLFDRLARISARPRPFSSGTPRALWTDPHISERMLEFHLDDATDLASRNEELVGRSTRWIAERFDLGPGRRVLDLGCGPGLYANRLARTGASVTGVDFSPTSIRHARTTAGELGLDVRYIEADYLETDLDGTFDLVLMIWCDYCVFAPADRDRLLRRVGAVLSDPGIFLFDVCSLAGFDRRVEVAEHGLNLMEGFWSPNPYFGFRNTFKYETERAVLDQYVIVEGDRTTTYRNWLQHYDPADLEAEVAAAGLVVHDVLGDVAGSPYDAASAEYAVLVGRPG